MTYSCLHAWSLSDLALPICTVLRRTETNTTTAMHTNVYRLMTFS